MNDAALRYLKAGLSVIPIRPDGSKAPLVQWQPYQKRLPTEKELQNWFSTGNRGIAIVGGAVSGNLLVLDFETVETYRQWYSVCDETFLTAIIDTLPRVETPGGGMHVYLRTAAPVPGNQKLAVAATAELLIETRAEGGYVLAPGSPPECHPSGGEYRLLDGTLDDIPQVTAADLADLIDNCRSFNERVDPERTTRPPSAVPVDGSRPGDDYNQRGDHRALLERHGWVLVGESGANERWRRPGKDRGWSATWHIEQRLLFVFSASVPELENDRAYTLFSLLAALEHGGDHSAAGKALFAEGYGERHETVPVKKGQKEHVMDGKNWTQSVKASELKEVLADLKRQHPRAWTGALGEVLAEASEQRRAFQDGLIRSTEIPPGEQPCRLWFGFYPASVVMIIGETGAGKSSLFYNIAIHAALGQPLWDVEFHVMGHAAVLYVDPENSGNWSERQGGQCARKLDRISDKRPSALLFHDGRHVNLADPLCLLELAETIRQHNIDICILDPIANLFNTEDENDNAEAARQMRALTTLSRETRACIVCCHHTGKDASGNYGRGASARLAAADVGMVFRARGNTDERDDDYRGEPEQRDDTCRLQIVKNRLEGRASLFLKMIGEDRFERVGFEEWQKSPGTKSDGRTAAEKAAEEILLFLADDEVRSRQEVVDAMRVEGVSRKATDEALTALEVDGLIVTRRLGKPWKLYLTTAENFERSPGAFAKFSSKLSNPD